MAVALIPHLVWLKQVDFVPLTYAGEVYSLSDRTLNLKLVIGYIGHNLALLAACIALAALALAWGSLVRRRSTLFTRSWRRGPNESVNFSHALNITFLRGDIYESLAHPAMPAIVVRLRIFCPAPV